MPVTSLASRPELIVTSIACAGFSMRDFWNSAKQDFTQLIHTERVSSNKHAGIACAPSPSIRIKVKDSSSDLKKSLNLVPHPHTRASYPMSRPVPQICALSNAGQTRFFFFTSGIAIRPVGDPTQAARVPPAGLASKLMNAIV